MFMILALIGVPCLFSGWSLMLVLTSVQLGWLPALGMGTSDNGLGDVIRHMDPPCSVCPPIPSLCQNHPFSILESISSDSIRAIRARESGTPLLYGSTL